MLRRGAPIRPAFKHFVAAPLLSSATRRVCVVAAGLALLAGLIVPEGDRWEVRAGAGQSAASVAQARGPVQHTAPQERVVSSGGAERPEHQQTYKRLGLHVTETELRAWRTRSEKGPFRVRGDYASNSPGDWERIVSNAAYFERRPNSALWDGPSRNNPGGCVRRAGSRPSEGWEPPVRGASALRDAAFVALIRDDRALAQRVKKSLLRQTSLPGVQFDSARRWCRGTIQDGNPGFMIATWMSKLLFAADYLEARDSDFFTASERSALRSWFTAAARWAQGETDAMLDTAFVDRDAGDYRVSDDLEHDWQRSLYAGGPQARPVHRQFNNRNARMARFVVLTGIKYDILPFREHGKQYVKEALAYSYFPEGVLGEFERWTNRDADLGWKYAAEMTGAMLSIADHLARSGDRELYRYDTTEGVYGTQGMHRSGSPKSLHTLVRDILSYVDGTYKRFAGARGDRIDSVSRGTGERRLNDLQVIMGNSYFDDPWVRNVYTRRAPGAPGYPAEPSRGSGNPASGEHGLYPGVLFMFGGLEGLKVYP